MDVRTALLGLKKDLYEFCNETKFLTQTVNDFANKFQTRSRTPSKTKRRAGNFIAAGGGVICAAGIGLSFVTLGGSIGVILVGGILCGIGGATNTFTGKKHNGARVSEIQQDVLVDAIEKYNSRLNRIKEKSLQIGRELESFGDIDYYYPEWCEFWGRFWKGLLRRGDNSVEAPRWSDTVQMIQNKQRSKKLRNSVKEVHVDVTGIDVGQFLDTLEDVRKQKVYKIVRSVQELVRNLEDTCPSKNEINNMIDDTSAEV